ncbi:hypothetical protein PROFUN_12244 [Planoprotostelium fungivorum]|uniref:Uncharacterized protein n=1 Tax=Planoprotostelium fungivorum TaxID=1890364 RepID=A0A2P6N813_9EUKA|nr:hypothetical protein PROFUN_12244 [Planoprotostelium fungivorum]
MHNSITGYYLEKFGIMWGVKDIECFYNKLRNILPSEAEHGNAVNIWKEKQFATFGEYMMYYCRCDVELLLQGTTNYRTLLMTKNNMELLNYVSVAQISYQNILKNYLKHDLRSARDWLRRPIIKFHSQYNCYTNGDTTLKAQPYVVPALLLRQKKLYMLLWCTKCALGTHHLEKHNTHALTCLVTPQLGYAQLVCKNFHQDCTKRALGAQFA